MRTDRQMAAQGKARVGTERPHGCFCVHGGDPRPHTRSFRNHRGLARRCPTLQPTRTEVTLALTLRPHSPAPTPLRVCPIAVCFPTCIPKVGAASLLSQPLGWRKGLPLCPPEASGLCLRPENSDLFPWTDTTSFSPNGSYIL